MKKHFTYIMVVAVVAFTFVSCYRGYKKTEEQKHEEIMSDIDGNENTFAVDNEFEIDVLDIDKLKDQLRQGKVKLAPDVKVFFDSIGYPDWRHSEVAGIVEKAICALRTFQKGGNQYYPETEVREALNRMDSEIWYVDYHNPDGLNEELFFWLNFATQATLLSPKVEYISNVHSEDHQVGLLVCSSDISVGLDLYATLLVRQTGDHCAVQLIDTEGVLKKIFNIKEGGTEYYLIYTPYEEIGLCHNFDAFLYEKGDDYKLVARCDSVGLSDFFDDEEKYYNVDVYDPDIKITYNPKKYQWDYCIKSGDYWHKMEGTKSLYLHFDEGDPYFEIH